MVSCPGRWWCTGRGAFTNERDEIVDFKVSIKCEKCKCAFELRPGEFADRDTLSCPNCGQELDSSVFVHLKTGIFELSQVPDRIPEDGDLFSLDPQKKPRFSLQVKEHSIFSND